MPLDFNLVLVDVFDDIVDSMRETGTIDSSVVESGVSTIQSSNSLSENEVITIDGNDYAVYGVTSTGFKITGSVTSGTWKSCSPYYEYGHPQEISNLLLKKDEQQNPYAYKKYPLIVLFTDIEIDKSDNFKYGDVKNLQVNIIGWSKYSSTRDKYNNTITPVLYPLYESFIKKVKSSGYFNKTNPLRHKLIERPFWGSQDKYGNAIRNMFNDPLDALELRNIELGIIKRKCN